VRDSEFSVKPRGRNPSRYAWGVGLVAAGAVIGVGAYKLLERNIGGGARSAPIAESTVSLYPEDEILKAIAPPQPARPDPPREATTTSPPASPAAPPPASRNVATAPNPAPAAPVASATAPAASSFAPPDLEAVPVELKAEAPTIRPGENGLENRIAATRQWLATEPPGTYTIQLLGSENTDELKRHLSIISKSIEINKIFIYRTIARQKPSLTVLYGSYNNHGMAKEALQALPVSLKAFNPILRTVQGIQAEIRRHESAERRGNADS
jgi:septal ring-binding cell division protein DamX